MELKELPLISERESQLLQRRNEARNDFCSYLDGWIERHKLPYDAFRFIALSMGDQVMTHIK